MMNLNTSQKDSLNKSAAKLSAADSKASTLKQLSSDELNTRLQTLVTKEKQILAKVLQHIAEVERRRLYLHMGYSNLFEYLTQFLGYANGSAQRRIDAARLLLEVPSALEHITTGALNLSQVGILQNAVRACAQNKSYVTKEMKTLLVENLTNKSVRESEMLVAQTLQVPIKERAHVTYQADGSVRLEVTLHKEQWENLQRMRELLSNSLPDGSWDQVFEHVADKVIEKSKTSTRKKTSTSLETPAPHATRLSPQLKKRILLRDQCCQYQDPRSGRQCTSRWKLQVDHVQPLWADGGHTPENLRVLCGNHNREVYRQQAGLRRG